MQLSGEDALRLNVLLVNKPRAIRIHESSMTLFGLMQDGEVSVRLNPVTSDEKYLKSVRSFLSEKALGSPVGYPLYLQRWTRQGQMRGESLEQLLLLGDPTAVFAVVCAEGLTDELASRAWWAVEEAENARRMLETEEVVRGRTGKILARYLVDFLPFETEPATMIDSVRLALQPGLLDREERLSLWKKAGRKLPYLVGFLAADPDNLPVGQAAHADHARIRELLGGQAERGNAVAALLEKLLCTRGQTFLDTVIRLLGKPSSQEVVVGTLDILRHYCSGIRPEGDPDADIESLQAEAGEFLQESREAQECLALFPELAGKIRAARLLSGLGYGVLRPLLKGSDALGSLMRRKLDPALSAILRSLEALHAPR